jgi:arsenate reductase (thioredoxin)
MKKVIAFVCTHNSCRSIMAEAWLKKLGKDFFDVYSAGTVKYDKPKPLAIEVMEDVGVDMSHARTKLTDELPRPLDILITMGCGVVCPFIPNKHEEDWGIEDPSGLPKAEFEKTRDIIKEKVIDFINRVKRNEI